jgi:hypothetical protein
VVLREWRLEAWIESDKILLLQRRDGSYSREKNLDILAPT